MSSRFIGCLFFLTLATAAQGQNPTRPEFEVASVKLADPSNNSVSYMPTLDLKPGATLRISNRRLDEIIMLAYDVGGNQISGPSWLTELTRDASAVTRYEIVAKVPDNATKEQIPLMLQKLLEDRFKLKVHRESKSTQVYSLEVSRGGHKLTPSAGDLGRPAGCTRAIASGEEYSAAADCYSITMEQLARQLAGLAPAYFREGPVVDHTGLTGTFDLRLEWRTLQEIEAGVSGATMFAAVKKLGLDLEKKRDNAEVLVVDHIEQTPTEN